MSQLSPKTNIYAFIDSQNLNLGVGHDIIHGNKQIYSGWKLDFAKFRRYLRDVYRVEHAYLFIGQMPENQQLYVRLQQAGYTLVFKPTQAYFKDGKKTTKGNVDAELVLYAAARLIDQYDQAIIVSGDGDFLCLYEYLEEIGKLGKILVPNKVRYSQLLKPFVSKIDYVSTKRRKLEHK